MSISANMRRDLTQHEKKVPHYYNDPANNCTFGEGILVGHRPCTAEGLGASVSETQMADSAQKRLDDAARAVRRTVSQQDLTQQQFDALVSFAYNAGATGAHHVLSEVNRGHFKKAAKLIMQNTRATMRDKTGKPLLDPLGHKIKKVLPGLVKRRRDESAPFQSPPAAK
jgi:lysozyme